MRNFNVLNEALPTMKKITIRTIFTTGLVLFTTFAPAQSFNLDWSTIDGGGGASSGGSFSLNGTIGQPDAGAMSGGGFAISGGFWNGVASGPESLPRLSIRLAGNDVVLNWPNPSTGYQLEQTSATGWLDVVQPPTVSGGDKEVTLPINAAHRFFRLRKP